MTPRHCQICLPTGRAALQWDGVRRPKCSRPHPFILLSGDLVIMSCTPYNMPDIDIDKRHSPGFKKCPGCIYLLLVTFSLRYLMGKSRYLHSLNRKSLGQTPGRNRRPRVQQGRTLDFQGLEWRCEEMRGPRDAAGGVCSETQ